MSLSRTVDIFFFFFLFEGRKINCCYGIFIPLWSDKGFPPAGIGTSPVISYAVHSQMPLSDSATWNLQLSFLPFAMSPSILPQHTLYCKGIHARSFAPLFWFFFTKPLTVGCWSCLRSWNFFLGDHWTKKTYYSDTHTLLVLEAWIYLPYVFLCFSSNV